MRRVLLFFIALWAVSLSTRVFSDSLDKALPELKSKYLKLRNTDPGVARRAEWEDLAARFTAAARAGRGTSHAPAALFDAANLYEVISKEKEDEDAAEKALALIDELVATYPRDPLADDALIKEAELQHHQLDDEEAAARTYRRIIAEYRHGDLFDLAHARLAEIEGRDVPVVSSPKKTRRTAQGRGGIHVVLDPGHGGEDFGAKGVAGLLEKDVTLAVAVELEEILVQQGYRVSFTRRRDEFVPLAERTAFANDAKADLFISLHTNASPKAALSGLEVYYLDNTNDAASQALAERENDVGGGEELGDLQFMLSDLIQSGKLDDSVKLAQAVERELVGTLQSAWKPLKRLGVKKAPFYVLVGAHMPCILVEMFFIDNEHDGPKLAEPKYRKELAQGIARGIFAFDVAAK